MDFDSGTGMWAYKDEIALFAPRATWEPLLILVTVWTKLHDEQRNRQQFFVLKGDVRLDNTAFSGLLDVWERT
jgi:hypothetical protein